MQGGKDSASGEDRRDTQVSDATDEFEEYTAAPRLDARGQPIPKSRGLRGAGYEFPPRDPNPPLTKANLAKGVGVEPRTPPGTPSGPGHGTSHQGASNPGPAHAGGSASNASHGFSASPAPRPASSAHRSSGSPFPMPTPGDPRAPAAPMSKVADDGQSEVYERPDLQSKPRTGRGLRSPGPEAPRAGDILAGWKEPTPDVVVPRKFHVFQAREAPKDGPTAAAHNEAEIHASVDVSSAPDATMSHSSSYGPTRTVVDDDPLASLRSRRVDDDGPVSSPSETVSPQVEESPSEPVDVPTSSPPASETPMPPPAAPQVMARHESRPHISSTPRPNPAASGGARIAIVQATFNLDITDAMAHSAVSEAKRLDAEVVAHVRVPGAFDTPLAAQRLLKDGGVDAVVVIGCIIQGETGHDELIAHATAKSLQELALRFEKPVGLAITGPRMTEEQARARIETGAFAVASVAVQLRNLAH